MTKNKIVTKGVAFNIEDPEQKKLLEYAMKRTNFSAYIKLLIHKDMNNTFFTKSVNHKVIQENDEDDEQLDNDFMKNLI